MAVARKSNRLSPDKYVGKQVYFLTINTAARSVVFVDSKIVDDHLSMLRKTAEAHGFDVPAFCFMPDHLHLLVSGKNATSDLVAFMKHYKQISGYAHKQATGQTLWQKSFYDHILRKQEDIMECATYILANPVRKHLVAHATDYPYSGSLVIGDAVFASI